MIFKIGYLTLKEGEALVVGDPCYFDKLPGRDDLIARIETGWPAGDYPVYVELEEKDVAHNTVLRLIIVGHPLQRGGRAHIRGEAEEYAACGVDSGQMAFAAAGAILNWTDSRPYRLEETGLKPASDYEAACFATLHSQLGAGALATRQTGSSPGDYHPIATAFASSTAYGDGVYPVNLLMDGARIAGVEVLFQWDEDDALEDYDTEELPGEGEYSE